MAADRTTARPVVLTVAGVTLGGDLTVPADPRAVVLFAHGSGSSRHSPRNRHVAAGLQRAGYATVLMDLLTAEEERLDLRTRELRFDIPRLAARLTGAVDWLAGTDATATLPVVTFGASTGAAAALISAADRPDRVRAVVSRGGRPDLAADALARVRAPTLLVVGGDDPVVRQLNEQAARQMTCPVEVAEVPGASHLFEEPGALDEVIRLTVGWLDAQR
ncbi:MAG: alpha/beta hydrolase [Actinomycetota bacterium]|nr:alpha/beta hydrolase [Actinomycetota bacterium]